MKIITRGEFLKIEGPVMYTTYYPCVFGDLAIKTANCGNNDWTCTRLDGGAIECDDSEEHFDTLDRAVKEGVNGQPVKMDFASGGRDGLFDPDDSKMAIYDEADVLAMVERLMTLLPNHELVKKPTQENKLDVEFLHAYAEVDKGVHGVPITELNRVNRCWNIYFHGFMDRMDDIAYVKGNVDIEPGIYDVVVYDIPATLYLWKYTNEHPRDLKGLIVRKGDTKLEEDALNKYNEHQEFI